MRNLIGNNPIMHAMLSVLLPLLVRSESYSYFYSGLDWSGQCVSSHSQSPVDLTNPVFSDQSNSAYQSLHIEYTRTPVRSVGDRNSYRLLGNFGTITAVDGNHLAFTGSAKEVAFHAPSEHLVNGQHADLELQIFHDVPSTPSLPKAALSVLFTEGDYNAALGTLINNSTDIDLSLIFNAAKSIPNYYTYPGSSTVPGCEILMNWYVDAGQRTASKEQLDYFRNRWQNDINFAGGNGNNRLPQALFARDVTYFQSNAGAWVCAVLLYLSF